VDPKVQVGLLVDPGGFPLEVHLFEGNKAETTTLVPVLHQFQSRHGIADMVVAADAGMLSAANPNALEDAGFSFIGGSRISKTAYDLAEHFERHGNHFTDGLTLGSVRTMGTGANARDRRVACQYSCPREKRDNHIPGKKIEGAEKGAAGNRPLKKDRFVTLTGKKPGVGWGLVERARQLLGLEGVRDEPAGREDARGQTGVPPDPGGYRGAPGRGVLRLVGLPAPAGRHRGQHQEAHPDPAALAQRDDRDQRPHPHRCTHHRRRGPRNPRPTTGHQRPWTLSLCNSGPSPSRTQACISALIRRSRSDLFRGIPFPKRLNAS
jgi:hypothetical protein